MPSYPYFYRKIENAQNMSGIDKQLFSELLEMTVQRLDELLEVGETVVYKKGDKIAFPRDVCDKLGVIVDGAIRTYAVNDKGQEISYLLQVNGSFFGDYKSYISGSKSELILEAILDTEALLFDKKSIDTLCDRDVFWLKFSKKMSDVAFLEAKERLDDLLFNTPEERYNNLLRKSGEVIQKIPQKYISTYLGITPQSLSRIRKRIG